jgi:hypothetical protein
MHYRVAVLYRDLVAVTRLPSYCSCSTWFTNKLIDKGATPKGVLWPNSWDTTLLSMCQALVLARPTLKQPRRTNGVRAERKSMQENLQLEGRPTSTLPAISISLIGNKATDVQCLSMIWRKPLCHSAAAHSLKARSRRRGS